VASHRLLITAVRQFSAGLRTVASLDAVNRFKELSCLLYQQPCVYSFRHGTQYNGAAKVGFETFGRYQSIIA
jgi:hypothetical protein